MKYLNLLVLLLITNVVNAQTYATIPFNDDFEGSGTQMGINWTISSTLPQGKVDRRAETGAWPKFTVSSTTKGSAYTSSVDPSGNGMAIYNTANTASANIISASLALNANNLAGLTTKFNVVDWGTGYSGCLDSLKVYISTNGGNTFGSNFSLVNLNQSPYNDGIWNTVNLDISGLATSNSLVLSSTTIIKYVFNLKGKGDTNNPKSGNQFIYIDNFSVTSTGALPIDLISFNGELEKDNVYLSWTTASEIGNEYFTIERQELSEWVEVGRVNGAGYSNDILNYNFIDEHITEGIYYYRLKQTDFDGQYTYSDIVLINYKPEYEFSVFPNPSMGTISLTMPADMDVTIKITNIIGQTIYKELMSPDNNIITIEGLDLANGFYHITADYGTCKYTANLILKK